MNIERSADHHYTYEGQTYPGVTSILKVIDKSGPLMAWAARQTAEAAVALMDTMPELYKTVGPEGIVKALTSRSSWKRDEAAALGTEIHALADLVNRGEPTPPIPESSRSHVLKYAEWWRASGWKLRASEAMLVNVRMGYGGTIDLLARDADKRTVLADIKTGRLVYHEAVLQLAAYGMAEVIEVGGEIFKMPAPDRFVILHVTKDGVREVELTIGSLDREAFAGCLKLNEWQQSMKGRDL